MTTRSSKYLQIEGRDPSEENPLDFYPTPENFCTAALHVIPKSLEDMLVKPNQDFNVLDAGSGTGNWGRAARKIWPTATIDGVDIVPYLMPDKPYDTWFQADYRDFTTEKKYDRIVSNPPYTRTLDGRDMILAEKFVRKSMELTSRNGMVLFLVRLDFLAGEKRCKGLFNDFRPTAIYQSIRRIPFFPELGNGQTHNFCLLVWNKSFMNDFPDEKDSTFFWFDWLDGKFELI